jgi:hypothetical protein
MSLEMKQSCEKCGSELTPDGDAFICSFECTFCVDCTKEMHRVCPNCGGELALRPKRKE